MSKATDFSDFLSTIRKVAEAGAESSITKQEQISNLLEVIFSEHIDVGIVTPKLIEIIYSHGDPGRIKSIKYSHWRTKLESEIMELAELLQKLHVKYKTVIEYKKTMKKVSSTIKIKNVELIFEDDKLQDVQVFASEFKRTKKVLSLMELCGVTAKPSVDLAEVLQATNANWGLEL